VRDTTVKVVKLSEIAAAARNPNKLDDTSFQKLRDGIKRDGFLQPVLLRQLGKDSYELVDGHHRAQAARDLKLESVPAVVVDASEADAARLAVALNKLRGELDPTIVADVFADLIDSGVDAALLEATGYSHNEVAALLASANEELDGEIEREIIRGDAKEIEPEAQATPVWTLELSFGDREVYAKVKRALRKAGGDNGDMVLGLLALVDKAGVGK
jgi:ParB/RepB/Spo0J family partition protein